MRFRLPKPYTILITRTGETPVSVTLRPLPLAIAGLVALAVPVAWSFTWITGLISQNTQLTQRNQNLTETAGEVLLEIETLDQELDALRERAGLPQGTVPEALRQTEGSQGGVRYEASAESLFNMAKSRVPRLNSDLEAQVRPALEQTLAEESARAAAFPNAKPLKQPLNVSSEFGLRPNPFGGRGFEMHSGIDFRGPVGLPIHATADGIVTAAKYAGGYGNQVVINHGYGHETLYAHLSAIEVNEGDRIRRGDVIGALGSTGRSSGPHLHYEVHRDGQAVNPRYYLQLEQAE